MNTVCVSGFCRDEHGGGTIMGLLWFMLLVGITGLAVDVTDGFRNRTMLQATADASALAAVIDRRLRAASAFFAVAGVCSLFQILIYHINPHSKIIIFSRPLILAQID